MKTPVTAKQLEYVESLRTHLHLSAESSQESEFAIFAAEVQKWQRETFPGGTAMGAGNHLLEEAHELVDELNAYKRPPDQNRISSPMRVREEAADVLLLLIAVAGLEGFDLLAAAEAKMEKNRNRTWETAPNARGYRKHIDASQASEATHD